MGESTKLECLFGHRQQCLFLSVYVDDIKLAGRKQNLNAMCKTLMKRFLIICTGKESTCKSNESMVDECRNMFESRISAGANEKLHGWEKSHANTISWSHDMEGHASK